MSNFDETLMKRLTSLEREVERLKVKESPGAWADWTPTETGWTALPTGFYRYCKVGKLVTCRVGMSAGTSDATGASLVLPFTNSATQSTGACGYVIDNGNPITTACRWAIEPNSTTVEFYTNFSGGAWTASGSKRIYATFTYEAA